MGKENFKTITLTPTAIISASAITPIVDTSTTAAMPMIATSHTASSTARAIVTAAIETAAMVTQTVGEAKFATEWISQGVCYAPNVSASIMTAMLNLYTLVTHL